MRSGLPGAAAAGGKLSSAALALGPRAALRPGGHMRAPRGRLVKVSAPVPALNLGWCGRYSPGPPTWALTTCSEVWGLVGALWAPYSGSQHSSSLKERKSSE